VNEEPKPEKPAKKARLTAANLEKNEEIISRQESEQKPDEERAPPKPNTGASKRSRPAWSKTKDQLVQEEEEEIDDLIDFAYDLDYEKYVEDMEVRQALALIKDRVDEIKQDNDWKDKLKRDHDRDIRIEDIRKERRDADAMSVASSQMS